MALTAIQVQDDPSIAAQFWDALHNPSLWEELEGDLRPVFAFSEYAAFAEVVPVRQSPLELHSLGALMTAGGGVGGGAMIGAAVATGSTPLLLLLVPAGIVLVTATVAFSEGLRYQIHRLMGVPVEGATEATEATEAEEAT